MSLCEVLFWGEGARTVSDDRGYEGWWDTDGMIRHAKALQEVAKHVAPRQDDDLDPREDLFLGKLLAQPVLLALATEIALKALRCRERKGPPDYGHDLVELFDTLNEDTQDRLQVRLPEHPFPRGANWARFSGDPFGGGMRTVLEFHRDTFKEWRYLYEHMPNRAWPPQLDEALTAIIEAYNDPTLPRPALEGLEDMP